ncbi:MAG: hypothetical protein HYZ48_02915 [Chlamydiales bacterium]|nr:hypothetical protein [Chlamydiales bacterium]
MDSQKKYGLTGAFEELNCRKPYKFLYLPGFFVEEKSAETRKLRAKYICLQKQIHAIYSDGNFLETTLERLEAP